MKIKRIIYAVCIFMIALFFQGNIAKALDIPTGNKTIQECINWTNNLQLGTSVSSVLVPYHEPGFNRPQQQLVNDKNEPVLIVYCRTGWVADGLTTDDEFTPLVFTNNILTSVGWAALGGPKTFANRALSQQQQQQALQLELQRRQHEQNFWKGVQDFGLCLGGYITC